MEQKKRFRALVSEEALSEELLVRKVGKTGEEVIRRNTRKIEPRHTKEASPGRTDAIVKTCLQTKTLLCRMGAGRHGWLCCSGDGRRGSITAPQAEKQEHQLALVLELLDKEDTINRVPIK